MILGLFIAPVSEGADSLRVMASIKPIHSIIAGLMEDAETPELLIDDQIPYAYSPTEEQLASMRSADILFWVGAELEPRLAEAIGIRNLIIDQQFRCFRVLHQSGND
ncbi:MAG: hypothetical protein DBP01_03890, partial [gamma proteobacterium symbiont of Ctena orbiculata]